jgi:hypothetical protein
MNVEILRDFFFRCMPVNAGVYALTAVASLVMRDFICALHKKMFDMDAQTTLASVQKYPANYKLFITAFNFAPWLALLIMC